MTIWGHLFQPSFIGDHVIKGSAGRVWSYWIFWGTVISLFSLVLMQMGWQWLEKNENRLVKSIPAFEATFEVDGTLKTSFTEAQRWAVMDEFPILLDTEGETYSESDLGSAGGILIQRDRVVFVEQKGLSTKNEEIYFSEFFAGKENPEPIVVEREKLAEIFNETKSVIKPFLFGFGFLSIWFFLLVMHLLFGVFVALLSWAVASMLRLQSFGFAEGYFSYLYFQIPIFVIMGLLLLNGVSLPFFGSLLLVLLFGMNFWDMKQKEPDGLRDRKD